MKRVIQSVVITIFFGIVIFKCNVPVTEKTIIGTYINTNYDRIPFVPDIPYLADTLILNRDKTFSSGYYGNGTFMIDQGFFTTKIRLTYEYEMGQAGFSTSFSNKIFEKTKMILDYDMNHYYEKE